MKFKQGPGGQAAEAQYSAALLEFPSLVNYLGWMIAVLC